MDKNKPAVKGLRTALQAIVGSLVGLVVVVWQVEGVPEAVTTYASDNWLPLLLAIGIPSGLIAWVQNLLGR